LLPRIPAVPALPAANGKVRPDLIDPVGFVEGRFTSEDKEGPNLRI